MRVPYGDEWSETWLRIPGREAIAAYIWFSISYKRTARE